MIDDVAGMAFPSASIPRPAVSRGRRRRQDPQNVRLILGTPDR